MLLWYVANSSSIANTHYWNNDLWIVLRLVLLYYNRCTISILLLYDLLVFARAFLASSVGSVYVHAWFKAHDYKCNNGIMLMCVLSCDHTRNHTCDHAHDCNCNSTCNRTYDYACNHGHNQLCHQTYNYLHMLMIMLIIALTIKLIIVLMSILAIMLMNMLLMIMLLIMCLTSLINKTSCYLQRNTF